MSNPIWPDPATLPFMMFGKPADTPSAPPLTQGLAGGMDLIKKFWGNLPGGTALPGFLVPTVDVEELDKRLSDLRAAESWLEVNLNMLRATIQGLEVQRNTIAAIHSLSAMADGGLARKGAAAPSPSGLPTGWPVTPPTPPTTRADAVPAPAGPSAPVVDVTPPADAAQRGGTSSVSGAEDPVVKLAANNWLGFMQEQFMKVAQAAVAPARPENVPAQPERAPAKKAAARPAKQAVRKKARRPTTAR